MPHFILHWYWVTKSYVQKHLKGLVVGLLIGILAFTQGPSLIRLLPMKNVHYVGQVGTFPLSELPLDIQQRVSFGLTEIKSDGSTVVAAAQTMTVNPIGTGDTYTFTLNPNTFWSDGKKLIAQDINLQVPDVTYKPVSDETVTFTLNEPFAPFPIIMSQPLLKIKAGRWPLNQTTIIGLKDYQISQIDQSDNVIHALTLKSKTDIIHYRFFPTESDAVTAFKLGRIDTIENLTAPYLSGWPNVVIKDIQPTKRYLALFFNTTNPALQDKTIRQILSYATPKKSILTRVISPISKYSWAYNPQVKPYDFSISTAQGLIDKLKTANPNLSLSFEFTTTPTYVDTAQEIINAWAQLGIQAKLKIVPYPDTGDYQVLLIGQEIPDDPDQYALWHSTQSSNITHYQNPKIDKLLEDGRREQDQNKRKQIYQDFQRFLLEDSPATFLYELPLYTISRKV